MDTKTLLAKIESSGVKSQIVGKYDAMEKLVSPSAWKDQVNSILSKALNESIKANANVLNSLINKLTKSRKYMEKFIYTFGLMVIIGSSYVAINSLNDLNKTLNQSPSGILLVRK